MPDSHEFITSVNQLLAKLNESGELNTGLEIANRIMILLGSTETEPVDNIVDEHVMQLPNAERYDHWFQNHPWMGGERAAFEVLDAKETPIQAKFYWLKKRSRQFIAGGVHFTENWEDAPYTRNDSFKIGIDFFLAPDGKSLLITLSNKGNLRIVELQNKLNNTQVEIFTKWREAVQVSSIEALHNTLWDSFMLQSVNKEFYKGVANSFTELLQHLKDSGREEEASKLFASRLLGRLLFVWFLRKKHIIDESMGYFDATSASSTTYYRNSLERLFFNTLNVPIDDRDEFKNENQKRLLEVEDNEPQTKIFQTDSKTPYLNGGLFEPHENDWYRDTELTFPEGYFTNLFEHFNQFNFTTDESTPEYEQVAIDPEMLGQVFESLLATQVDETGQQARKAKGAFYTPREIVSYMCKESLRNYLYGKVEDDERYTQSVDLLLDRSDHEWAGAGSNSKRDAVPKEYRSIIVDALDTVTVLDPACGSGAFPMGILQLLIKTYERLEGRFDPYKTKLQIVQNNIFGVDIEPMAIEIARLRAWLSLIVDEEESQKVAPLPNLDFKFVCANSLIPLDKEQGLFADNELHQKLKDTRIKYFNARVPSSKKKLQVEYNKLADSSQQTLMDDLRTKQLKSFDPFRNSQPAEFFDPDQMFGLEDGFDLVIGNPPYVKNGSIQKSIKDEYNSIYSTLFDQWDLYIIFFELSLNSLKKIGTACLITPNQWLSAKYGTKLRVLLAPRVSSLVDFRKFSDFENAAVNTFVTVFSKPINNKPVEIIVFDEEGTQSKTSIDRQKFESVSDNLGAVLSSEYEIIDRIDSRFEKTIGDYYKVGHSFSIPDFYKLSELIYENPTPINNEELRLVSTGTLGLLGSMYGNKVFKYDGKKYDYPVIKRKDFLANFSTREIQTKPKLIISSMGGLNIDIDYKGIYLGTRPTMWLAEDSDKDLRLVYGLLSSKLINWYYEEQYSVAGMTGFKVRYKNIEETPFPNIPKETQEQIISLVDDIIRVKESDPSSDITSLQSDIDQLVYKLYELNPEEIKTVESKMS